jgi:hypothetical protein
MFSPIFIDGKAARQIPYSRVTKIPLIKDWLDLASSDPRQLSIWSSTYPGAVPGVLCDQWSVLDVDSLDWLHEHEHLLPPTYNYRTARGRHFYFERVPHLKSSVGKSAPKIDVKSGRAGVIYWPAINGLRPVEAAPAPFPEWLLAKLRRAEPRCLSGVDGASAASAMVASSRGRGCSDSRSNGESGPSVFQRRWLPRALYDKMIDSLSDTATPRDQGRVRGILHTLVEKREGRNDALNWAGFNLRQLVDAGVVTRANAEKLLLDAAIMGISTRMASLMR